MNEDLKQLNLNKLYFFYMYIINMADNTGLFIVLMIFCVISIASSVLMSYTCTDGTWDFDNFKASKCVKIPDDDTDPDDGITGDEDDGVYGGEVSYSREEINPASLDNSVHYALCSGAIVSNDAKTCWNESDRSAGVRWVWSEAQEQALCKGYAAKYRIIVSSNYDDHVGKYYYDKSPGTANSFRFKNSPNGWLKGMNVKFVITALTSENKRVISPVTVELDASESTDDCDAIGAGTAVDWSEMIDMPQASERPPPPPPTDCTGGEWVLDEEYGCLSDGVKQDKTTCGPSCMEKFDKKGDDFVNAANGGTCELTKNALFQRQSCSEYVADEAVDCQWDPWTLAPLTGNSEPYDARGINGTCSKSCAGGTQRQARYVSIDDENVDNGEVCGTEFKTVACNTQACPIHCQSGYQCGGWEEYQTSSKSGGWTYYKKRKKRTCNLSVSVQPNAEGMGCPTLQSYVEDELIDDWKTKSH
jgi:hypothetical protein|tara:strand:+ start:2768 stop:4189 length:1422 start_codon:yes stop_codon:yes gene_type:complete